MGRYKSAAVSTRAVKSARQSSSKPPRDEEIDGSRPTTGRSRQPPTIESKVYTYIPPLRKELHRKSTPSDSNQSTQGPPYTTCFPTKNPMHIGHTLPLPIPDRRALARTKSTSRHPCAVLPRCGGWVAQASKDRAHCSLSSPLRMAEETTRSLPGGWYGRRGNGERPRPSP